MRLEDIPFERTRAPEPEGPPLSDLLRGGADGRRARRWHLAERLLGMAQIGGHHLTRALSTDLASGLGARFGPLARAKNRQTKRVKRMHRAISLIRPDIAGDEAARDALLDRWWTHTARVFAEFAVIDRLGAPDRCALEGGENMLAAQETGAPLVILMIHTGHWELMGPVQYRVPLRKRWFSTYQPQANRYQNRIVHSVRRRHGGYVFPPSVETAKLLFQLPAEGYNACLFVDEVSEGDVKFPLFGRPTPKSCNIVRAVKLAQKFGSRVLPAHSLRTSGAHYVMKVGEGLAAEDYPGREGLERMIADLSAIYEPIVRDNLDQWYHLQEIKPWRRGDGGHA